MKRCKEIFQLREVNLKDAEAYKEYRLAVKRSIYRKNLEFLPTEASELKQELDQLYKKQERNYFSILKQLQL